MKASNSRGKGSGADLRWDHTGIKTADLACSLQFYCDILGLQQREVVEVLGRPYYFVGNASIQLETEAANPTDTQADMRGLTGLYHLVLAVDDLDALAARLREHNVRFILPPAQFRPDRKIAFIADPDGVFIQLSISRPRETTLAQDTSF